jgi:hypothetical protein
MASGVNLENRRALNRLDAIVRAGKFESHAHRILIWGLYAVAGSAFLMFAAIVAHKIRPGWWLTEGQESSLQSFLFSGVLGAAISAFGKRVFRGTDQPPPDSE